MVFDTLTWRDPPSHLQGDIQIAWTHYLKRIRRRIGAAVYGSERKAQRQRTTDYVHYQCVVEHGSQTGRLHMHVVWFFRDLPSSWKQDPNTGLRVPRRREIEGMKEEWHEGFSVPIAVRTGPRDVWSDLGWRWPVHNGEPAKGFWLCRRPRPTSPNTLANREIRNGGYDAVTNSD